MGAASTAGLAPASAVTPVIGSESETTPRSESDPDEWFYSAAQTLLGKDAGYALHLITGYPQSSCYAYVAHNRAQRRRPPEHFLRKLFARREGEPFHSAFMAASGAPWWSELQRARRIAEAIAAVE